MVAAAETGVPLDVLRAISLAETGRTISGRFQPWPWTVNSEGVGKWFDSSQAASQFALAEQKSGKRSFDVGCFQLNFRWHGKAFRSVDHMFEPRANARYAAQFLSELFKETGNWQDAAAFYHSRTPEYANKYRARFTRILANLDPSVSTRAAPDLPGLPERARGTHLKRENRFPLLLAGHTGQTPILGSLFPDTTMQPQPLIGD